MPNGFRSEGSRCVATSAGASSREVPELPETETIARDLDGAIRGRQIKKVSIRKADVLREVTARTFAKRLRDARIVRSWRRAKLVDRKSTRLNSSHMSISYAVF